MIRRLRIKFICVVMAIVTVMLAGIFGVVLHFTAANMKMQSISMMRAIANHPFQQSSFGSPSPEIRLPFFSVQITSRGELITAGGGYFDLSDLENLQQVINAALNANEDIGLLEDFDLRFLKAATPAGFTLVFADTTTEAATLRNMIYNCLVIFWVAMLVFLGISILLSHWAIRPVETAWNQQRQFVADASHELKTPLTVIMSNAELLQNEDATPEEQTLFSQNILSMSYQMRRLVENLLEMARVDNGAVQMRFAPVDFSQIVSDAVLSFQLLYAEQGLGLSSEIPEELSIQGSEQHLYQVLDVLLDNALKYSTPLGMVRVTVSRHGRSCLLCVASPGTPLSPADLKNIFKRFYRADKARAMNGSYGLGLSIAEAIVTAHKGKIWAESRNGENLFFVQLPMGNA